MQMQTTRSPKKFKPRFPVKWFTNRVGQYITKNCANDLFNPSIRIISEQHAKALHASQDKGNRYE